MSAEINVDTRVIRLVESEIGANPAQPPGGGHSLPEDVLREAAQRLGVLCLISALVWTVNLLLLNYVYAVPGTLASGRVASYWKWRTLYDAVIIINVLGSLGLFWFARRNTRRSQFILDLALVYEVLTALSVGILDYAEQGPTEGVSWIAVIILLFAPIVPSTPGKTLGAAVAAATMGPVGALIWRALGMEPVSLQQILLLSIPNYLCAAMAPVVSHIITRLGREVRQARGMGNYLLGELIARGGMGEVWQATHRFLVRPAAIKLIKPDVFGADRPGQAGVMVQRFRREARRGRRAPLPSHYPALRLRAFARRHLLLRHGAAQRTRSSATRLPAWPPLGGPNDLHPETGVRGAGRGPRAGSRPPRHQAGEHSDLSAGT